MSKLIPLIIDRAKTLHRGDIVYEKDRYNADNTPRRWKVNGKVKRWKGDSNRISIPVKHGLYNYGYIDNHTIQYVLIEGSN